MSQDPDPPGPAFKRFIASVGERPRYRPAPAHWRHWLPMVAVCGGILALGGWKLGRIVGLW